MSLPTYYDVKNYKGKISKDDLDAVMYDASRHIDSLTFNRIIARGYENLTDFQKEILSQVCLKQAEFEYENKPLLDSVLSSYSLNGVSMGFDAQGWNVHVENGIVMQGSTYELLKQTGLCCRSLGVR